MFVHVSEARYQGAYRIWLRFDDDSQGTIDLEEDLAGPVFEPLRDPELFKQFHIDKIARTIVWPNGAGLAPEYLRSKVG